MLDVIRALSWGKITLVIALVTQIVQFYRSEERQAVLELWDGLWDTLRNIPRRWTSEIARVRERVALLRRAGLDDKAAVRAFGIYAKGLVRVVSGTVEDVLNLLIDIIVILLPFSVSIAKAFLRR